MNPFRLDATALLVWGGTVHLVVDWLLQNEWMQNKINPRHPAGYVHAGLHGVALAPVFGWPAALIAVAHFLIDLRHPVAWWSRLMRQTQPDPSLRHRATPLVDVGMLVRFNNDQVWHIACIAIAALVVG